MSDYENAAIGSELSDADLEQLKKLGVGTSNTNIDRSFINNVGIGYKQQEQQSSVYSQNLLVDYINNTKKEVLNNKDIPDDIKNYFNNIDTTKTSDGIYNVDNGIQDENGKPIKNEWDSYIDRTKQYNKNLRNSTDFRNDTVRNYQRDKVESSQDGGILSGQTIGAIGELPKQFTTDPLTAAPNLIQVPAAAVSSTGAGIAIGAGINAAVAGATSYLNEQDQVKINVLGRNVNIVGGAPRNRSYLGDKPLSQEELNQKILTDIAIGAAGSVAGDVVGIGVGKAYRSIFKNTKLKPDLNTENNVVNNDKQNNIDNNIKTENNVNVDNNTPNNLSDALNQISDGKTSTETPQNNINTDIKTGSNIEDIISAGENAAKDTANNVDMVNTNLSVKQNFDNIMEKTGGTNPNEIKTPYDNVNNNVIESAKPQNDINTKTDGSIKEILKGNEEIAGNDLEYKNNMDDYANDMYNDNNVDYEDGINNIKNDINNVIDEAGNELDMSKREFDMSGRNNVKSITSKMREIIDGTSENKGEILSNFKDISEKESRNLQETMLENQRYVNNKETAADMILRDLQEARKTPAVKEILNNTDKESIYNSVLSNERLKKYLKEDTLQVIKDNENLNAKFKQDKNIADNMNVDTLKQYKAQQAELNTVIGESNKIINPEKKKGINKKENIFKKSKQERDAKLAERKARIEEESKKINDAQAIYNRRVEESMKPEAEKINEKINNINNDLRSSKEEKDIAKFYSDNPNVLNKYNSYDDFEFDFNNKVGELKSINMNKEKAPEIAFYTKNENGETIKQTNNSEVGNSRAILHENGDGSVNIIYNGKNTKLNSVDKEMLNDLIDKIGQNDIIKQFKEMMTICSIK